MEFSENFDKYISAADYCVQALPLKVQPLDPRSVLKAQRPGTWTLLLRRKFENSPVAFCENDPGMEKW